MFEKTRLKVDDSLYDLSEYYIGDNGTLTVIVLDQSGTDIPLFYHPGSASGMSVIMKGARAISSVLKRVTSQTVQGKIFWGVVSAANIDGFIDRYKRMGNVAEGYYHSIDTEIVIKGRLTSANLV